MQECSHARKTKESVTFSLAYKESLREETMVSYLSLNLLDSI